MKSKSRILHLLMVFTLTACGGTVEQYGEDDVEIDSPADVIPDPTPDPIPDPTSDPIPDPTTDPIPDPTPDPIVDTTPDITTDVGPGTGAVGEACSSAADCSGLPGPEVQCMSSFSGYIDFPGGYCTANCTDDSPCGVSGSCVGMYGYGICMKPCTSSTECRTAEGYTCNAIPYVTDATFCVPPF